MDQSRFAGLRGIVSRWWWVAVALLFAVCVAARVNGSSIGRWQLVLGEPEPIRGLVAGTPKNIRSDEWVVWTPSILAQARHTPPFPIENPNLGAGRAPLIMSVPVAYYTTFFRPQLWGFFLLDLERGFAWFWCTKIFGLLLATAWLFRQIGIRSPGIVAFGSVAFFFSSFTQWWFSSPAMLPEMVASWAICVGCVIACTRPMSRWRVALAAAGLVFFGINFVLCLYPPFQIPLVFLGAVILLGLWLERRKTERDFRALTAVAVAAAALVVTAIVLIPFWHAVAPTLEIVAKTEYPAGRENKGGGYTLAQFFSGPLNFFDTEDRVPLEFPNICEASNFYPLWVLGLIGVAAARFRHRQPVSPLFVVLGLFIAAVAVYCTVELPSWVLRVTLFAQVHEARALLSLGLANILLFALFLDRYRQPVFGIVGALAGAAVTAAALAALFYATRAQTPAFFADGGYISLLVAANAAIIVLFFWEAARRWLPAALVALLICSNVLINPVMRGLGPMIESPAYAAIAKLHAADPEAKWIAYGDHVRGQLIKATGAQVLNGTKIVPDLEFWRTFDPSGAFEQVYNRYAWIICEPIVFPEEVSFTLLQMEFYSVALPPGLKPLRELRYDYYVFPQQWSDAIFYDFKLATNTPDTRLWVYRRDTGTR